MKKFLVFLFIGIVGLSVGVIIPNTANAQDQQTLDELEQSVDKQPVIIDFEGLRLTLNQQDQNPGNRFIKYDLTIKSNIESDRIQLTWNVTGRSVPVEWNGEIFDYTDPPEFTEVLNLKVGEQATRSITVLPRGLGLSKVVAVVEAFEIDGTRVATASKTFASDSQGVLLFAESSQNVTNVLYYARLIGIVILTIIVLLIAGFFGYKQFHKWLNT